METLTEINHIEHARRDRAAKYEAAINDRANAQVQLEKATAAGTRYAIQVSLLAKLIDMAQKIDISIDVSVSTLGASLSGQTRGHVLALLSKAQADQARRRDDAIKDLTRAKIALQKAEATLASLT